MVTAAVVLTGCINQSAIQAKYTREQDQCRDQVSHMLAAGQPAQNAAVAARFSDCMNRSGWHVPVPKPGQVATGPVPNPPSGSPSVNPIASAARVPVQGTAAQPYPPTSTTPAAKVANVVQPSPSGGTPNLPSGAASTNPSAKVPSAQTAVPYRATTSPVTGQTTIAPATYQPARPVPTTGVTYGQGAGRQF